MKKKLLKIFLGVIAISLLISGGIAFAQDSSSFRQVFKLSGTAMQPYNSSWTLGSSGTPIANGYFTALTAGTLTISSTVSGDLSVGGVIKNSNGTVALPSYTFTGDPDTGFYWISSGLLGFSVNNSSVGLIGSGLYWDTYLSRNAGAVSLKGQVADSGSAVGVILDNTVTLSTAGAKLLSVRNNTTEKAYFDYQGSLNLSGYLYATTHTSISGNSLTLNGQIADGASAVGLVVNNTVTLSTAGAKIVSWRNNTAEKSAMGLNGELMAGAGTASLPSLSFLGDPNTGFYNTSDVIKIAAGGSTYGQMGTDFRYDFILSNSATTLTLKSQVADGGTAVAIKLGSYGTLSTAGAKLASFINNTTEKASIDLNGTFGSVLGTKTLGVGDTTFAAVGNVMTITCDGGGNTIATITAGVTGQTLILKFVDALCTITDTDAATANTVNLSAAFTSTANDTMTLMFDGTKWFETARSVN